MYVCIWMDPGHLLLLAPCHNSETKRDRDLPFETSVDLVYETLHTKFQTDWCSRGFAMSLAKCHFWQKTEKSYYCFLARAAEGEGMVTFALASAVIMIFEA